MESQYTFLIILVAMVGLMFFTQHAQPHRHPSIKAGRVGFNQTGANHQLVAGKRGFGGGFFQGGNEKLAGFHGVFFCVKK